MFVFKSHVPKRKESIEQIKREKNYCPKIQIQRGSDQILCTLSNMFLAYVSIKYLLFKKEKKKIGIHDTYTK